MSQIILKGPFWTPAAPRILDQAIRDAEAAIADEIRNRVRLLGQSQFRYENVPADYRPGYWLSQIRAAPRAGYHVVTDGGIIYGHWLEGTGSRNRTTRFKGYFMWRKAFQSMNRGGALRVAEPIIARTVRFLNG